MASIICAGDPVAVGEEGVFDCPGEALEWLWCSSSTAAAPAAAPMSARTTMAIFHISPARRRGPGAFPAGAPGQGVEPAPCCAGEPAPGCAADPHCCEP